MNKKTEDLIQTSTTMIRYIGAAADPATAFAGLEGVAGFTTDEWTILSAWAQKKWPVVRLAADLAAQFGQTEPPDRDYDDDFHSIVIEIGEESDLVWFNPEMPSADPMSRLIRNVWYVLSQHQGKATFEGVEVTEHTPSAKANRKRGRKYYPGVEWVIGATRKIHIGDHEPQLRESGPREGWTQSVRTLVHGFWRNQAHGPQHSLRKVIWVQPFWRGPDDAPVGVNTAEIVP